MRASLGDRLEHVLEAIEGVRSILNSDAAETLATNRMLRMALEREFEIICETSRHIPAEIKASEKGIDWQRMIDLGNRLRHAYDTIQLDILLLIARTDLPPLKTFVERILAEEKKR